MKILKALLNLQAMGIEFTTSKRHKMFALSIYYIVIESGYILKFKATKYKLA
ncbi:hypothetical protein [Campylobacter concisus]